VTIDGYNAWPMRELEIVTVAELFAAAGFPVPEGARIAMTRGGWGFCEGVTVSLFGHAWTIYGGSILRPTDLKIDLSRLPALDAWDALPQIIKDAVKS